MAKKAPRKKKRSSRRRAAAPPETSPAASALGTIQMRDLPIGQINAAPYNPRVELKPGDPEYERLARSIDTFGYVDPLIWNERTGNLVGGHQRLSVLADKGATAVTVSVVQLSDADERALNIALNKVHGRWDTDKLGALLRELEADVDVDLAATGFDTGDIDSMLAELEGGDDAGGDKRQRAAGGGDGGGSENAGSAKDGPAPTYQLLATCANEAEQKEIYELLKAEGVHCRVLLPL